MQAGGGILEAALSSLHERSVNATLAGIYLQREAL
jgi:hypothetical protein